MGGELVHEMNYHTQPKSAGLNHVLVVLIHLLYCIDLYNVQVLAYRHMILLTQKC